MGLGRQGIIDPIQTELPVVALFEIHALLFIPVRNDIVENFRFDDLPGRALAQGGIIDLRLRFLRSNLC